MANFFSLQDGNLTDSSVYGYSLTGAEVMNNTTARWLSTTDAYSPTFRGDGTSISAVAIHLSARVANPTNGTLILKLSSVSSVITETYAISSFTSFNGSNNLLTPYPQNWQILKLTTPYALPNLSSAAISLATLSTNMLMVMCSATNNNYDKAILKTNTLTPVSSDGIHIGGALKGLDLEPRTITASTSSFNNLYIHNQGTLNFPLTSSTTLTLVGSAGLQITSDGTLNIGTSSSFVPLSTTHTITLSNTQIDVHNGGNLNVYGYPRLTTTNLTNDTLSGSRTFTTTNEVSEIWNIGDTLVFKPNLSARTSFDTLILSSFTAPNTFTTTTSSVFTHTGSATYNNVFDVYNLTRNVRIQGNNTNTIRSLSGSNLSINNATISGKEININNSTSTILSSNSFNNTNCNFSEVYPYFNLNSLSASFSGKLLDTVSSSFTVELWIYPAVSLVNQMILAEPIGADGKTAFTIYTGSSIGMINGTNLCVGRYNGSSWGGINTTGGLTLNKWHHIAVTFNGSIATIFINGLSAASGAVGFESINFNGLYIGQRWDVGGTEKYQGSIRNIKITKNQILYTSNNFIPSFYTSLSSQGSTSSNVVLLALTDNNLYLDKSPLNNTIQNLAGTPSLTTIPVINIPYNATYVSPTSNVLIDNNIFFRNNGIKLSHLLTNNFNFNNNYILSSNDIGLDISNLSGSIAMSNNTTIGSLSYGTFIFNNTLTSSYGANNYNSNLQGMMISGSNTGTIIGGGLNSAREGVYVDASTNNLSGLTFQNISANSNSSVGFKISGNSLNYSTPIILNINGLIASTNNNSGIEAYNIIGNLSSVIANNNLSASRIGIGSRNTVFDGLTSFSNTNCIELSSTLNYNSILIKNALLSSSGLNATALRFVTDKLEDFRVENSILSATVPLQITSTRSKLEGLYSFHNSNSNSYGLSSLALTGYQTDGFKEGIIVMRENGLSGNHYKYTGAGSISLDKINVNFPDTVSERLTPWSNITKLRSTSKLIPVNIGDSLVISVFVKKSVNYTGASPRLMLVGNASLGYTDSILFTSIQSSGWENLYYSLPASLDSGVIEVYVDCSGNVGSGYINIDSWNFN